MGVLEMKIRLIDMNNSEREPMVIEQAELDLKLTIYDTEISRGSIKGEIYYHNLGNVDTGVLLKHIFSGHGCGYLQMGFGKGSADNSKSFDPYYFDAVGYTRSSIYDNNLESGSNTLYIHIKNYCDTKVNPRIEELGSADYFYNFIPQIGMQYIPYKIPFGVAQVDYVTVSATTSDPKEHKIIFHKLFPSSTQINTSISNSDGYIKNLLRGSDYTQWETQAQPSFPTLSDGVFQLDTIHYYQLNEIGLFSSEGCIFNSSLTNINPIHYPFTYLPIAVRVDTSPNLSTHATEKTVFNLHPGDHIWYSPTDIYSLAFPYSYSAYIRNIMEGISINDALYTYIIHNVRSSLTSIKVDTTTQSVGYIVYTPKYMPFQKSAYGENNFISECNNNPYNTIAYTIVPYINISSNNKMHSLNRVYIHTPRDTNTYSFQQNVKGYTQITSYAVPLYVQQQYLKAPYAYGQAPGNTYLPQYAYYMSRRLLARVKFNSPITKSITDCIKAEWILRVQVA